jgi:hypothetical protein
VLVSLALSLAVAIAAAVVARPFSSAVAPNSLTWRFPVEPAQRERVGR